MNFRLKLKYKKVIFAVSLGTMAIGLAILSINTKGDLETSGTNIVSASPSPESTSASPSPTASGDGNANQIASDSLQKNAVKEVNEVVNKYLEALVKADIKTLQTVLSKEDQVTKEDVTRRYEFYEAIKNIDCYTLPGVDNNSYITYVYYDAKLVDIETMAPGLICLYITKGEDGKMTILTTQTDSAIKEKMDKALKRADVQELVETVNANMQLALASDLELKSFFDKLQQAITSKNSTPSPSASPAASPAASKAPATSPAASKAPAKSPAASKAPAKSTAPAASPKAAN